MSHFIKAMLVSFLLLFPSWLFWSLNAMGGLAILTFACGLAIAGVGNWLLWTIAFIVLGATTFFCMALFSASAHGMMAAGLGFGLLPMWPALLLWIAHRLHLRSRADD